ncbi:hypothetical protein DE146DRAFT_219081 [Phaeosphaeria sp. MPI-PUGE-AT-0046c]|nr:hypothetical protein DE146DRAFT_219081 [Phaeosphaeria sp. MPI-PUGE-AT-0046c]
MRQYTAFTLLLPALVFGSLFQRAASANNASPPLPPQPASAPTSQAPIETLRITSDVLELRQDPSQALSAISTIPVAPTITTISTSSTTSGLAWGVESEYTTTQWVETWINSTSRTWVPKTITLHFPSMSPAPRPGRGEIGMGTLASGDVGKTEVIAVGAAPTQGVGWEVGVGVAVGFMGAIV